MPLLQVDKLEVRYGQIRGTRDVSFTLEKGETLALVGSNGAGKSSTLKAILGMAEYAQGEIRLDGQLLKGKKPSEIVRLGIGYSPEGRRVFQQMSVAENLKVGAFTRALGETALRMEQIFGYFPRLKERAKQRAGSMSGGEQQMLAIGRALMSYPKVFLLDEPSLGLAPVIVGRIGELLHEIQAKEGLAVILAEQNANWALRVAQRAAIIELGHVTMTGPARDLAANSDVKRAYLGL